MKTFTLVVFHMKIFHMKSGQYSNLSIQNTYFHDKIKIETLENNIGT